MKKDSVARVHYFERQFLRAEDFTDEQAFHLAMHRRHSIAHHSWGIVQGLTLAVDSQGSPCVQPGLAVDGYGREMLLPEQRPLPLSAFTDKDSDVLDVWLEYDRLGAELPATGYIDCGADPTESPYRWVEQPRLRLSVPDPAETDRRKPEAVPEGDWDFPPSRVPPDDPQQDWPVFLGRVERKKPKPDKPYVYSFDLEGRPYAGQVGEAIVAPSDRARVRIGTAPPDDDSRFAVYLWNGGQESAEARLTIDDTGTAEIRGETHLYGDLTMDEGAIDFTVGTVVSPDDDELPAPWRIYRVDHAEETAESVEIEGDGSEENEEYKQLKTRQLRIEMQAGTNPLNEVVIGVWSEDDKEFRPCLTVSSDCSVRVEGNLVVNGRIVEAEARGDRAISEDAQGVNVIAQSTGMSSNNIPVQLALLGDLAAERVKKYAGRAFKSEAFVKALVATLSGLSEEQLSDVAKKIKDDPGLLEKVAKICVTSS